MTQTAKEALEQYTSNIYLALKKRDDDRREMTETALIFGILLLLSGCALCPSMDDNCWLIKTLQGESTDTTRHLMPEEACVQRGGKAILKAGEYDRCNDGQ